MAGVHFDTLYAWLKKPTLSDAIKKAEADAEIEMVEQVRKAAKRTWTAAAWWLERKVPNDWGKRERVTQDITVSWRDKVKQAGHDPNTLFRELVNAARASAIAGGSDGSAVEGHATDTSSDPR